ncbi:MAG TPA: hypothetical protein VFQ61_26665 [Polyangiaceae bacterium]|nr:hypothetical protein [Polyangiaceae bacterium]
MRANSVRLKGAWAGGAWRKSSFLEGKSAWLKGQSTWLKAAAGSFALAWACAPKPAPSEPRTETALPQDGNARPPAARSSSQRQGSTAPPPIVPNTNLLPGSAAPRPCGELGCVEFSSAEAALTDLLRTEPRVLALGEIHAPKSQTAVPSTATRFGELLPLFAGRSKDLVIELLLSSGQCGAVEKQVETKTAPIREPQAASNQNEFVELGFRAKALGIQPRALTVACKDYARVAGAGSSDIDQLLALIGARVEEEVTALLPKRSTGTILVYGGALHNDLHPRPGRERWSFGPSLAQATNGAYAELDLVVPEYVADNDTFRAQVWYSRLPARPLADAPPEPPVFRLLQPAPRSYVLIFPWTTPHPTAARPAP